MFTAPGPERGGGGMTPPYGCSGGFGFAMTVFAACSLAFPGGRGYTERKMKGMDCMNMKRSFRGSLAMLTVMILVMTGLLCGCKTESIPQTLAPGYDSQGLPIVNLWVEGSQEEEAAFTELIRAYNALPDRKATAKLQFIRSGVFDAGISSRYSEAYLAGE